MPPEWLVERWHQIMGFLTFSKYRLIVAVLLILIVWQIFRLLPNKTTIQLSEIVRQLHQKIAYGFLRAVERFKNIAKNERRSLAIGCKSQLPMWLEQDLIDARYNKHKEDKVKVKVYYEALCPDSKHFFIRHLAPVSEKLAEFMDVTLVPYGKATTKEENGKYYFMCQHGEDECYANKIHACSIEALANNDTTPVMFTACMITDNADPDAALQRCAKQWKVDPEPIANCATHDNGSELLKIYGEDTNILAPRFIPMITLNGYKDNQAAILKNFLLEVCKMIDIPLPPPCL